MIMVAAISSVFPETKISTSPQPKTNQNVVHNHNRNHNHNHSHNRQQNEQRRRKAREIPSRYMSMSPCSSNSISSTSSTSSRNSFSGNDGVVRSQSTSRRSLTVDNRPSLMLKPSFLANSCEISASTRSFGSFSVPIRTKDANQGGGGGARNATPERRTNTPLRGKGDGGGGGGGGGGARNMKPERWRNTPLRGGGGDGNKVGRLNTNPKAGDQLRWPARSRQFNTVSNESTDCIGSSLAATMSNDSLLEASNSLSFDGTLNHIDSRNCDILNEVRGVMEANSVNGSSVRSDLTGSDSESISSGGSHGQGAPRGIVASTKFWQETNMRLRRLQDPSSKFVSPPKLSQSRKFSGGPTMSPKMMLSPTREVIKSASRVRTSVSGLMCCSPWEAPSVLSFVVDVRRGNVGGNRINDAHQLRLLYNRHLQWRFVTARADAALSVQKRNAERNIWNAWIAITGRRESVRNKRIQLQLLRQKLKLTSVLRRQIAYLEEWAVLDERHSCSVQGAIESLKASTLRLPVVDGVTADVEKVKDAISSAVDVMQSIASSLCFLSEKVEEVNSLTTELSKVAAKERITIEKCIEVLSVLSATQVKDCSLRTHILQLNRLPLA
ncbi:hypothetical protein RND81_08G017800 [Saponaria officinalis]|uniref:QWRF motif-containing protein 2 n=1 Tax=Saponaria officinalis TaxID=3572 RepID=A0AAW1J2K0_SAPOF